MNELISKINILEKGNKIIKPLNWLHWFEQNNDMIFTISFLTGIIITIIGCFLEYDKNNFNNIERKIYKILKILMIILIVISTISFISISSNDIGVSGEKISDTTMMIPLTEKNKHNLETEIYYEASKGKIIPIRNIEIVKKYITEIDSYK